jgi:hypothetical protein
MDEGYTAAATKALLDDVERLTRFDDDALAVLGGEPCPVAVEVEQAYQVEVKILTRRVAGDPGAAGVRATSESEFGSAVATMAHEARCDAGRLQAVRLKAATAAFGELDKPWALGKHGSSVTHTFNCGACGTRGTVRCHNCGGQRQVRCLACSGAGETRCSPCSGRGGSESWRTEYYNGEQRQITSWQTCIHCNGSGTQRCNYCMTTGWQDCPTCGARGEVTCSDCGGAGKLSDIASFELTVTPELRIIGVRSDEPAMVSIITNRVGLRGLEGVASAQATDWNVVNAQAKVEGLTRFALKGCVLHVQRGNRDYRVKLLGEDPEVLDYDGMLEDLLEYDLAAIEAALPSLAQWPGSASEELDGAIADFCANEANQQLLREARGHAEPAKLFEAVKGMVSESYAARTIAAMRAVVARITRRHLAVGSAIAVAAAAVASAVLVLGGFDERILPGQQSLLLAGVFAGFWLVGGISGWLTANARLATIGGPALREFARRADLGIVGRLSAGWKAQPSAPAE